MLPYKWNLFLRQVLQTIQTNFYHFVVKENFTTAKHYKIQATTTTETSLINCQTI